MRVPGALAYPPSACSAKRCSEPSPSLRISPTSAPAASYSRISTVLNEKSHPTPSAVLLVVWLLNVRRMAMAKNGPDTTRSLAWYATLPLATFTYPAPLSVVNCA